MFLGWANVLSVHFIIKEMLMCNALSTCPPFPCLLPSLHPVQPLSVSSPSFHPLVCFAPLSPLIFLAHLHLLLPPHIHLSSCLYLLLFPKSHLFLSPRSLFSCLAAYFSTPGRRRDLGDKRRKHQGHEARASHRAHQERRTTRPSGAQEGGWLRAWIWWVNLRKHSLLTHLHTLSRGRWMVAGWSGKNWIALPRLFSPSRRKHVGGEGLLGFRSFTWWRSFLCCLDPGGGRAAVTCSQFPCRPAVTFHLLASEQMYSSGTFQDGGGSDFSVTLKKETVYRVWMAIAGNGPMILLIGTWMA